jgi:transcriptional regulator with PAS, ATPase and Fis domain
MIRAGTFREDLFYRLNVIELRCRRWRPPGDILPLANQGFLPPGKSPASRARKRRCWRTRGPAMCAN